MKICLKVSENTQFKGVSEFFPFYCNVKNYGLKIKIDRWKKLMFLVAFRNLIIVSKDPFDHIKNGFP